MDTLRLQRWKRACIALLQVEPFAVHTVQALGKVDSDLFEKDVRYRDIRTKLDATSEEWAELQESVTLAYLWILDI